MPPVLHTLVLANGLVPFILRLNPHHSGGPSHLPAFASFAGAETSRAYDIKTVYELVDFLIPVTLVLRI